MINKFKLSLLSGFLLLPVITNCTGVNSAYHSSNNSGYVMASVKFPQKGFNLKTIPSDTALILVRISGDGIDSKRPLSVDLYQDNPTRIVSAVPQGNKRVKANAFDSNGNLLASGENTVNVIAQKLNRVEIELKEIKKDPSEGKGEPSSSPNPNPSVSPSSGTGTTDPSPSVTPDPLVPTPEPCIVKVGISDMPISKSLESAIIEAGCKIQFPQSPSPTPEGGGGGSSNSSSGASVNSSVTVIDGDPIDVLTIETPGP